jgi:hypothetical protein
VEVKGSNPSTSSFLFLVLVLVMVSRNGIFALNISCISYVQEVCVVLKWVAKEISKYDHSDRTTLSAILSSIDSGIFRLRKKRSNHKCAFKSTLVYVTCNKTKPSL